MSNEQISREQVSEIFPNESYARSLELIERIKKLVPFNKDKVIYLETLISYVDGLINGDDIHQYITSQTSEFAKNALREIISEVHEQTLESYRLERMNLQDEVSRLGDERDILDSQVRSLQDSKANLVRETSNLSIELDKLKRELQELKANGIRNAQEEVSGERKRLSDEIRSLYDEKDTLSTSIGELKAIIDSYNKTISKLNGEDEEVIWEPLSEDSPVYSLNSNTIDLFITSLIHEYMEKTGEDEKKAENIIKIKCPGLYTISSTLKEYIKHTNYSFPVSVSFIIEKNPINEYIRQLTSIIQSALSTIKLPVYRKKKRNIDTLGLNKDSIPTNISTMLRELYLQRMATEAIAKQKILESQLEYVIGILKNVVGPEYDFSSLISNNPELKKLLGDAPTLSL